MADSTPQIERGISTDSTPSTAKDLPQDSLGISDEREPTKTTTASVQVDTTAPSASPSSSLADAVVDPNAVIYSNNSAAAYSYASAATSTPDKNLSSAHAVSASTANTNPTNVGEHYALTLQTLEQLTSIFCFPRHIAQLSIENCGPEDVQECCNWILDNYGEDGQVQDRGGPIFPKKDCPHVAKHVKLDQLDVLDHLETEGGIMDKECQHYCVLRSRESRKRLRSEDGNALDEAVGRPKCEEDYEETGAEEDVVESNKINDIDGSETGEGRTSQGIIKSLSCPKGENWMCLECGVVLCSRYANGHAKMHWEDTRMEEEALVCSASDENVSNDSGGGGAGHCIAVSFADLSVWCYVCNAYLEHPALTVLTKKLEDLKFGEDETTENKMEKGASGGDAKDCNRGNEEMNNGNVNEEFDESNVTGSASSAGGTSNRKGEPKKQSPEQVEKTDNSHADAPLNETEEAESPENGASGEGESDNSSDSGDDSHHHAAIISSLLQSEHGAAIAAYLSRHESFDPGNMSQSVPMMMPKPPTFPNEMADFLRSPLCRSIIVLAGAGMSVSSGIPDFRSAGVGLYDTLRPELLTASELEQDLIREDPTLALDKGMFLRNPLPMLELKRDFILGTHESRWKATLAHRFVEFLHSKLGKLTRLYTQNIDGLELQCRDLPAEKVVNVHGSMGRAACEVCEAEVDFDEFCTKIKSSVRDITGRDVDAPSESTPIQCERCGNPTVKPTIVLFRGSMPKEFHVRTAEDLPECDLLIVMGTSLTVAPANSLVYRVPSTAVRMIMNNEKVGRRLGIQYGEESVRDVFAHGHSDEVCLSLMEKMGWLDDLSSIVDELPESSASLLRDRLSRRMND